MSICIYVVTPPLSGSGPSFGGGHRPFEWVWRAVGLFPVSAVVGAAGKGVPLGVDLYKIFVC